MHNFKLIVAIMMSVVIMQLHASDTRESLDIDIQRCYTMSLKSFITTASIKNIKKDERYRSAILLTTALQQQRKNLFSLDSQTTFISQEILRILQEYELSGTKVTAVVASQEFIKLKKTCKDLS